MVTACAARTAILWAAGLVALMTISGVVGSDYAEDFEIPESGSRGGIDVLTNHFEGFGTGFTASIVFQAEQGVADPAISSAMTEMFAAVAEIDMVDVRSPYEGFGGGINADGTIGFAEVEISLEMTFNEMMGTGEMVRDAAGRLPVFFEVRALTFGAVTASMIAYMAAQFCDVYVFHFWKRVTRGKLLWVRNNGSTMLSQLVDSVTVNVLFLYENPTVFTGTTAVLSMGFIVFVMFGWPFIDRWIRKNTRFAEASVWIGIAGVLTIIGLTVWEAVVKH